MKKCSKCGHENNKKLYHCEQCGYNLSIAYQGQVNDAIQDGGKEDRDVQGLSYKYKILRAFKGVLTLSLILQIIGVLPFILFLLEYQLGWGELLYSVVLLFGIFGTYCVMKIIDFLFELDESKLSKSEEKIEEEITEEEKLKALSEDDEDQ